MASSPPVWVLEHTVKRLGLVVVEEASGAVLPLEVYSATCLAHHHPVSAIISHIMILHMAGVLHMVGVPLGLDQHHVGGLQGGLEVMGHLVVEAAALARGQLLVIKHMNSVL